MAIKENSKRTKPGRKPLNKPRRHIVFEHEVDTAIGGRMCSTGHERSWVVNHYVKLGLAAEKAA